MAVITWLHCVIAWGNAWVRTRANSTMAAILGAAASSAVTGVGEPVFDLSQRCVYQNDTLGHPTNILAYNGSSSSAARTIYQADYRGGAAGDGQFPLWTVDESGSRTEYQYDSLKRVTTATKKGVSAGGGFAAQADIVTAVRYDPTVKQLEQTVYSGGLGLTNRWLYDVAGRQTSATDEQGRLAPRDSTASDARATFALQRFFQAIARAIWRFPPTL